MAKTRVLVVEDSLTVRQRIVEVLDRDPELTVVAHAGDGQAAIELCRQLRPDVITMDMMLPVMTGLAATEYIMAYYPTPILIVSASTNRGELFRTYEALAAGAVDVLEKMPDEQATEQWEQQLISTVKLVSKIRVITHPRARLAKRRPMDEPRLEAAQTLTPQVVSPAQPQQGASLRQPPAGGVRRPKNLQVIAIGASTGGPAAVLSILQALPPTFPLPILLVLHISSAFATSLAEWLDQNSPLRVSCATGGEPLLRPGPGRVVMAPPDRHLVCHEGRLELTDSPERFSCRPSVDVLFESLAKDMGPRAAGCLLTGMGKDGAAGLLAMHRAGAWTAAQDEFSSVVFGMPREAIQLGAAQRVLPIDQVAPALVSLIEG